MIPLPEPTQGLGVHRWAYSSADMRAYGDAVRAEERENLRALIMAKHYAVQHQHNLYHCLAVEMFGAPKE